MMRVPKDFAIEFLKGSSLSNYTQGGEGLKELHVQLASGSSFRS